MNVLAPYFKAVVGFIAPGAGILVSSVLPGSAGGEFITQGELVTAVCVSVITAAGVWGATNRPAEDSPARGEDAPEHRAV